MSKLLLSPALIGASFSSTEYHLHVDDTEERKGRRVWHTAVNSVDEWNIISVHSQRVFSPHLSDGYATGYFGQSNSGWPPGGKRPTRASVSPKHPPSFLLFFTCSPIVHGALFRTDHLQKIISETLVIDYSINNTVHLLSIIGGWGWFMVKARSTPLGLVSMESYSTSLCDWGMPFFSPLLKCTAYSDSGYCGAHKWLSEEKGMVKERVGSRFKWKAPIGTPFLLSNLLRHKKSYSLTPKNILRERQEG